MKSRQEILDILTNHLEQIKKKYGVEKIGVFGSVVRSEHSDASDIDLLVEFSRPTGMVQFIRLEEELQGLLGARVDLVTQKALKKHIGRQILREVQYVN
ncbi:MAG: nucleotidyltransferase family protein [Desulfobulbaceae bacterium]|nr:nucleotidyltransferase family protein [Desulfobulbaceae bacterium]